MTDADIARLRRDWDDLKSAIYAMRNRVDKLEKWCNDNDRENKELQGKIATLAGRLSNVRDMLRG